MPVLSIQEIHRTARDAGFGPHQAVSWTAIALAGSGRRTPALADHGSRLPAVDASAPRPDLDHDGLSDSLELHYHLNPLLTDEVNASDPGSVFDHGW